jgi:hypothetical protein
MTDSTAEGVSYLRGNFHVSRIPETSKAATKKNARNTGTVGNWKVEERGKAIEETLTRLS